MVEYRFYNNRMWKNSSNASACYTKMNTYASIALKHKNYERFDYNNVYDDSRLKMRYVMNTKT